MRRCGPSCRAGSTPARVCIAGRKLRRLCRAHGARPGSRSLPLRNRLGRGDRYRSHVHDRLERHLRRSARLRDAAIDRRSARRCRSSSRRRRRVAQAAKVRRPLLLAYGGIDRRVPVEHGKAFRDAVIRTNPDVEWVEYPDEGHGWRKMRNAGRFLEPGRAIPATATSAPAQSSKRHDAGARRDATAAPTGIRRGATFARARRWHPAAGSAHERRDRDFHSGMALDLPDEVRQSAVERERRLQEPQHAQDLSLRTTQTAQLTAERRAIGRSARIAIAAGCSELPTLDPPPAPGCAPATPPPPRCRAQRSWRDARSAARRRRST